MATHEQLRWYAECLPLTGATVVDVGASIGELSAFFWSAVGETGRVVSVEPLASHVRGLQSGSRNTPRATGSSKRVRPPITAARSRSSQRRKATCGARSFAPHGMLRVPARRLAAMCRLATIVKLDIEGHEYVVLDDALSALPHVQAWSLELHMIPGRPLQGVLGLLPKHGLEPRIAGRTHSDPHGPWRAVAVPSSLDWSASLAMPRG